MDGCLHLYCSAINLTGLFERNICSLSGPQPLVTESGRVTQQIHYSHFTHCGAAHEDDYEGAEDASNPDHPGHPQEEDHPKNVLDTRQVHSHQSAQLWSLKSTNMSDQSSQSVCVLVEAHLTLNVNGLKWGL